MSFKCYVIASIFIGLPGIIAFFVLAFAEFLKMIDQEFLSKGEK